MKNNWLWIGLIVLGVILFMNWQTPTLQEKKEAAGISSRTFDKTEILKGGTVSVTYTSSISDNQGGWSIKMKLPAGWSLQESVPLSADGYYRKYFGDLLPQTFHLISPNTEGTFYFNQDHHCVPTIVSGQRLPCEWALYPSVTVNVVSCIVSTEVCNGKDDDCDNQIDEGLGNINCGVGECINSVAKCVGGVTQVCTPKPSSAETCDGKDNDCNGAIDNGLTQTQNCGTDVGYCEFGTQSKTCTNGVWSAYGSCTGGKSAITEICRNGIDEDCNGADLIGNTPADTNCDNCVSNAEFPSAVTKWETQTGISDTEWSIVVSKWESQEGC